MRIVEMRVKLILLLLIFIATDAFSQRKVSGVVVDENNEPIASALIRELALMRESWTTISYTTTNSEGEFTFTTTRNDNILRFSSFGYIPRYIVIVSDTVVTVKLERGRIVSGVIFDENNEPAHGAVIRIMGTNQGAVADIEGKFRLTTADSTEVQISSLGHYEETLKITSDTIVSIRLREDSTPISTQYITPRRNVSGIVIDEFGEPFIGARIEEISTSTRRTNATHANLEGQFELVTTRGRSVLRISFLGYHSEYIEITNDAVITVILREDGQKLICHPILIR